jgi:hypothetical protein
LNHESEYAQNSKSTDDLTKFEGFFNAKTPMHT